MALSGLTLQVCGWINARHVGPALREGTSAHPTSAGFALACQRAAGRRSAPRFPGYLPQPALKRQTTRVGCAGPGVTSCLSPTGGLREVSLFKAVYEVSRGAALFNPRLNARSRVAVSERAPHKPRRGLRCGRPAGRTAVAVRMLVLLALICRCTLCAKCATRAHVGTKSVCTDR